MRLHRRFLSEGTDEAEQALQVHRVGGDHAEEREPAAHGRDGVLGHEDGRIVLYAGGERNSGLHNDDLRVYDLIYHQEFRSLFQGKSNL